MELFCILTTVVIIQHRPVCLSQANRIVGKLHLKKTYLKKNLGAPGWHVTLDHDLDLDHEFKPHTGCGTYLKQTCVLLKSVFLGFLFLLNFSGILGRRLVLG